MSGHSNRHNIAKRKDANDPQKSEDFHKNWS